jgi:hypothetical protein
MILFECPFCAAQLQIAESRAGRSLTCAFCKGQVEIPKPSKRSRHGEYELREDDESPTARAAARGTLTVAELEALDAEEEPKKKRRRPKMQWQLVIGGFGFPWTRGAVMRWLLIAAWATVAGWLTRWAVDLGIGQSFVEANIYHTIVALLAAFGAIVTGGACASIAGIHGMTILLETTAGNDRIENWPNVSFFLDWIGQLWFLFNTVVVSLFLGFGFHWLLADILGSRLYTVTVVVFFAFPLLLLCTLETDSPFLPASAVVFASLGRNGIAWLAFYCQASCLLAAEAVIAYYLTGSLEPRMAIPLIALLFAAGVMIYFRLLGRLAFYCSCEPEIQEEEE